MMTDQLHDRPPLKTMPSRVLPDAKTMAVLMKTAELTNAVAEEALRRVVELMKEVRDLRAGLEVMRDAPGDCPPSWFVEQATRALEQEST